jgi:two-component system, OmpR family, response regulator MtrA
MKRILAVDDDPSVAEMLSIMLGRAGFDVTTVGDGPSAVAAFREQLPDLIVLDLMLPGMDGIEVCRIIRAESGVPIVMLTAKSESDDVVLGLEAGADDYVVKPPKPEELLARIRARLRPSAVEPGSKIRVVDLVIDLAAHSVHRDDQEILLTPLEFSLLVALAQKPGEVFTRERLLQEVWEYQHAADTRLVNVHVQRLRSKIEKDAEHPEIVITVRGIGYKAGQ